MHRRLALLLLLLFLVAPGCDHSHPTEEETQPMDPLPPNFSSPDSTLASLARAIHYRSTANFGRAFADTLIELREFHAVFDSNDVIEWVSAGHSTYPSDWRRSDEVSFFPNFVASYPDAFYDTYFTVDASRGGKIVVGGPTQMEIWNMHYRVWAGPTPVAAGSAGLTFERVGLGGEFKLTYWEDHRDTTNVRSWGKHRLEGR
jgi:hypothetical protein